MTSLNKARNNCPRCQGDKKSETQLCSRHLQQLTREWNKKLEKDGYNDCESYFRNGERVLTNWHSFDLCSKYLPHEITSRTEYFRVAGNFLYEHKFDSELERDIWDLHSQGLSIREICDEFKARKQPTYKDKVHRTLQSLVATMLETKCPKFQKS